jgi:muramidase (phage lysozyme)
MVGEIGASNRATEPVRIQVRNQFAGLGQAVNQLANASNASVEASRRIEEQAGRKAQLAQNANINTNFIKRKNEFDREIVELKRQQDFDATTYKQQIDQRLEEERASFMSAVPEDLRPEYEQKFEQFQQQVLSDTFTFMLQSSDEGFRNDLGDVLEDTRDKVENGLETLESASLIIEDLFKDSPLAEQEKELLREEAYKALETSAFRREIREETLVDNRAIGALNRPADGSNVVASNLPAGAPALLNTIASTESPGYDVMYGGEKFEDFSKHPNRAKLITSGPNKGKFSTAAGRYQFIHSTWEEAKNTLGLPDFSPESQDRAAWWLAQRDYRNRTGRDLQVDLASGDKVTLGVIRKTLGGTAAGGVTWEGLQHISDGEFFERVSSDSGTPSALIYSPRYSSLTITEREAMWRDANKERQEIKVAQQQEEINRVNGVVNQLAQDIVTGVAGETEIIQLLEREDTSVTAEQKTILQDAFATANKTEVDFRNFVSRLSQPSQSFSLGRVADEEGYLAYYERTEGRQKLSDLDEDYLNKELLPIVRRTNAIPGAVANDISGLINSANQNQAEFALGAGQLIKEMSPEAFKAFSDEDQSKIEFFSQMKGLLTPEEFMQRLNSPLDPTQLPAVQAELKEIKKDKISSFAAPEIANEMGMSDVKDQFVGAALESEYQRLFEFEYPRYRNFTKTREAVMSRMQQTWGETTINGNTVLMKNPPQKVYPAFRESHSYLNRQLEEALGEGNHVLIPNKQTHNEIAQGVLPAMQVATVDENGVINYQRDEAGFPLMFRPEYDEQMQQEEIEETVVLTELERVTEEYLAVAQEYYADLDADKVTPELEKLFRELKEERKVLTEQTTNFAEKRRQARIDEFEDGTGAFPIFDLQHMSDRIKQFATDTPALNLLFGLD